MSEPVEGKYLRRIRSFVRREGRLTVSQQSGLDNYWPKYGVEAEAEGIIDFTELFGNEKPVQLDIGFGMGESLISHAKARRDQNFLGAEVYRPGIGAALNRIVEEELDNVRIAMGDAVELLKKRISDCSVASSCLFFPDPWHKKKHHKRRLIQPEFVELLARKTVKGGEFHLATDWENYAEHMLEVLNASDSWKNMSVDNTWVERYEYRPSTKFERRGERLGHGVWDLFFVRV